MCDAMDGIGNASSVHMEGRRLRSLIEAAREEVAALVGADPSEVVFTSGATEGNVSALRSGFDRAYRPATEHDSVLAPLAASGCRVIDIPVDRDGVVDVGAFADCLRDGRERDTGDGSATVVAIQLANNETGVIQPVADLAALAREYGAHLHCDAVQAPGRIPVEIEALGADTLVISAHKLGGPKGIGAMVIRDGISVPPLLSGGGQERRRRAGTENVPAIAGFGAAAHRARTILSEAGRIAELRDRLEAGIRARTSEAVVFGEGAPRLPNTSAIAVAGRTAELMVIKLDLAGFAVSAGAACSSGKVGTSHVLLAMRVDPALARGAIRVSLGPENTTDDVDGFLAAWGEIIKGDLRSNPADRSSAIEERILTSRGATLSAASGG